MLASAEKLRDAARAAEALAYGEEGSASERVAQAARALAEAGLLDRRLEAPLALLRSAAVELEEAGRELGRYADAVGGDPERLALVEDRLELLRALARKHGGSLDAAIAGAPRCARSSRVSRAAATAARDRRGDRPARASDALALAAELSGRAARRRAAFAQAVRQSSTGSPWAAAGFEVALLPPESGGAARREAPRPAGAERAEILIAPNPGEPPRPLARTASGGELSRVLLAVKRTLARERSGRDLRLRRGRRRGSAAPSPRRWGASSRTSLAGGRSSA